MKQKQLLGALVALLLLGAAAFFTWQSRSSVAATLDASFDKASYAAGEGITLTVRLTNEGSSAICVSPTAQGSVALLSFTRDGEPVETRSTPVYFLTSFDELLTNSLVPFDAGATAEITVSSEIDDGLGAQALRTTDADDGRGLATFYDVATPGTYEVEVAYRYQGPSSSDCGDVLERATNSITATFTVTP